MNLPIRSRNGKAPTHPMNALWATSDIRQLALLGFAASVVLDSSLIPGISEARSFLLTNLVGPVREMVKTGEMMLVGAPSGSGFRDLVVFYDEDTPGGDSDPLIFDESGSVVDQATVTEHVREQLRDDVVRRYESARSSSEEASYDRHRERADSDHNAFLRSSRSSAA